MGPLDGIRVLEMAGLGPVPFTAMLLGDLGADVIRIDRPPAGVFGNLDRVTCRNRRSLALDLKKKEAIALLLDLDGVFFSFDMHEILFRTHAGMRGTGDRGSGRRGRRAC